MPAADGRSECVGFQPCPQQAKGVFHSWNYKLPNEFKASSSGGNAIDITYSFVDPANNHNAGHVFSITNNLDSTRSQTFSYDQLNRITAGQTTSTYATSPAHCWGETYQYDGVANGAWGNLTQIAGTTNSAYTGCTQESGFTKTVDANNHLSGFSYDSSGNTTGDGTFTYAWDGESQLKSAGGVNYLYDGDGRRVSKVGSKLYWYGSGSDILAETDASGNTTAEYIFFGGKRIAMIPSSGSPPVAGNPTYYVEDLLGTSRVLTTNTGVVCYDADFYPFGGERSYTITCPQNYKFEGKERDVETSVGTGNTNGNEDFGARYYSNRFGRWLSADWSAVPAPVPYANLTNPQTLNLYAIVSDDPESFADLDGHDPTDPGTVQTVVDVTMEEVDKVAGPLIESAKDSGLVGPAIATGLILGAAVYVLIDSYTQLNNAEANLKMEEAKAANDAAQRKASQSSQKKEEKEPSPDASGAGARKGGGRDDRKVNEKREQSAKTKEQELVEQRDALRSKANKTPADKKQLEKVENALQRERDRQRKSETHARKQKGQPG